MNDFEFRNAASIKVFNAAMQEYRNTPNNQIIEKRLYSCKAWVYETPQYFILRSYNTFIACYDKTHKTFCDVLRHEYGYTSTSNQHYSKFKNYINTKLCLFWNFSEWRYK